jgi:hypothetical protein
MQQTFHCVNCTIVEADCGKLSRTAADVTTTAADVTTTPAPSPAITLCAGLFTAAIAAVVALASARF